MEYLYHDLELDFVATDVKRPYSKLAGANVTITIERDDFVLRTIEKKTDDRGLLSIEMPIRYPLFYPGHCYDIVIEADYLGNTFKKKDDFKVHYTQGAWSPPNMDWLQERQWDYLPQEYRFEPRENIDDDLDCNK